MTHYIAAADVSFLLGWLSGRQRTAGLTPAAVSELHPPRRPHGGRIVTLGRSPD